MKSRRKIFSVLVLALSLFVAANCLVNAQVRPAPNSTNISGRVVSLKGPELIVASPNGDTKITVPDKTIIRAELPIKLSEITSGMYVAATATKQPDGTFLASRVNVFSEDQRGFLEGHGPLGSAPQSGATMTNANVERVEDITEREVKGRLLNLKYKGGEINVLVPPDASVVKRVVGDRALIKTGSELSVTATQEPDGSLSAQQITVRAPKR